MRLSILLVAIAIGVIGSAPGSAPAAAPTEQLRPAVDQILKILDDPALKGSARTTERRAALRAVMDGVIDYRDAARRALGVHWQGRTAAERDQFVALFRDVVSQSYIATMEGYTGEKVTFVGEVKDEELITVTTRIQTRRGTQIPIDYRMHQQGERWYVYDVSVEGVSLVSNYRAQFNTIIRTASYDELVRRLRARVVEPVDPAPSALPRSDRPRTQRRDGAVEEAARATSAACAGVLLPR